jgi:hypothetical protein
MNPKMNEKEIRKKVYSITCQKCKAEIIGVTESQCLHNFKIHFHSSKCIKEDKNNGKT